MLPDFQIARLSTDYGLIDPFDDEQLQPASYDLTLGNSRARMYASYTLVVGADTPDYAYDTYTEGIPWILRPRELALFQTAETLHLPGDIAGKFEGKSSLGRIGMMTHVTAGFIDPGFHGVLTLEVCNCGPHNLALVPGIRIGQVSFTRLRARPARIYGNPQLGSHYQGADTVQGGRFD